MADFNENKKTAKRKGRMVIVIMPILLVMSIVMGLLMINSLVETTNKNLVLQTKLYAEKYDVLKNNKTEYIGNYFSIELVNDIVREGIVEGAIIVDSEYRVLASAPIITDGEFDNYSGYSLPARVSYYLRTNGEGEEVFLLKGEQYTMIVEPLTSVNGYLITYAKTRKVMSDVYGVGILTGVVAIVCISSIFIALARQDKKTISLGNQLGAEEVLIKCARCLANNREFESATGELLGYLSEYYHSTRAYIFQIDEAESLLKCTFEWHKPDTDQILNPIKSVEVSQIKDLLEKLDRQGFFRISDRQTQLDPHSWEYTMMFSQDVYSFLAVPFTDRRERITGFLAVGDVEKNIDAVDFLTSVASFVKEEIIKKSFVDQLVELSYTDKMTKTGNRHAYVRDLEALQTKKTENVGVIFADVNGLKITNDAKGHEAGDQLLIKAAKLLRSVFTDESNRIYRIGGDEFVVISNGIQENDFYEVVHQLLDSIGTPPLISIGETWIPVCENISDQVKVADKRMYERKSEYYRRFLPDRRKAKKNNGLGEA